MPELKRFFTPPVFQDDEEKTRTANVLNTILLGLTVVYLLAGVAVLFVFVEKLGSLLIVVVLLSVLLVVRFSMQRGQIRFASVLLVSGLWVGVTILVSFAGGMTCIHAAYYIMVTVIAGLLLGTHAALVVAGACSLTGLAMVVVESIGYPLPRVFPVPASAGWLNLTFGLFMATIALNITLRSLHDALALARQQLEERKKAEEALQESEQRFRTLAEASFEGIALTEQGVIVDLNDQLASMLGHDRGELIGKPVMEAVAPESRDLVAESIRSGRLEPYEHLALRKDGMVFPVEVRARIAQIAGRQLRVTAIRDVTERKQVEEVLRESEERHRSLFENSPISLWEEDFSLVKEYFDDLRAMGVTDFRAFFENRPEAVAHCAGLVKVLDVNKATVALVGARDKDELLAGLLKILADEAVVVFQEELITLAEGGQWFESEEVHRTLSGEERFIVLSLSVAPGYANSLGKVLVSVLDITERKRAEEALRRSEDKFAKAFRTSPDAINIHRMGDGQYLEINDGFTAMTGYTSADVAGKTSLEINIWADPQDRARLGQALREHGEVIGLEAEFRTKDGSIRTGLMSARLIDVSGEPCILSITRDITDRKRIEEALRENEARYRAVIESQVDLISRYLPDTTLTFVNDAYCRFYGKTREELIGHSYLFMIAPEFRELVRKETENLAKDPRPIMGEYLNYRQDGKECWIQWAVQCISDENGQVVELQAVGHDITERKRAEEALKDSQERYRTLFEDSPVSLWEEDFSAAKTYIDRLRGAGVQDLRNYFENHPEAVMQCADMVRVVDVNKAALEWHHVANKEALQGNLSRLLSPEGCEDIKEELMGLVEGGTRYELASARQDRGGNPLHLIVTGTVAPGYEDSWGRVLVSILDITELKRAEEALRQYADENARLYREVQGYAAELEQRVEKRTAELSAANAELARASRAKDEFLSGMSHELRTPLTAILGLSEVLQEQVFGPLNEKQAKYVQTISESGHHLLSLITDILDLSKIEAGKMELEIGLVAIDAVCQASLQFIKQTALKKQLKVCSTVDQQVTLIQADERRLKQILVNLLSNAVKFTPAGGQVGLEVVGDVERGRVDLSVWDTGIGIASEDMGRLFQSFVQLDSSLSRQYTGTGLGLALVRQLTDLHGGSVSVESQVGQGSRFTVSLPWHEARGRARVDKGQVGQAAEKPGSPVSEFSGQLVTILLAEDNETNLGVMSDYVSAMGYRVIVARDGHEAIRRASEEKPEVILMDIQMPGLDGLEAIRRIRTEAGLGKTPIIALTALTMPGDREHCLEAGANDYLSKPVGLRNLLSAIEAQLAQHEREE